MIQPPADTIKICVCKNWTLQAPWDTPIAVMERAMEEHLRECPPLQRAYLAKQRVN